MNNSSYTVGGSEAGGGDYVETGSNQWGRQHLDLNSTDRPSVPRGERLSPSLAFRKGTFSIWLTPCL